MLAKFKKEGVEIDGKITSIIGDGIGRIQADAARYLILRHYNLFDLYSNETILT